MKIFYKFCAPISFFVVTIIFAIVFLACQLLVFFGVHDNKYDKFIDRDFIRDSFVHLRYFNGTNKYITTD